MWTFFKSVFAGQDHIEQNIPCQDYADYTITENGIYVAALSDGASASRYADIAASCNVNAVLNVFHKSSFEEMWSSSASVKADKIIDSCLSSLFANVKRIIGSSPVDFAATLLFMASDGKRLLLGHIGDGVICGIKNNSEIEVLSAPHNVNNEKNKTFFTITRDAEKYLEFNHVEDISGYSAFILMSDGPETSFFDYTLNQMRTKNLLTIVDDIGKERAREIELTYFLKSNFWKHGITGDDCSMVVFARESDVE